MKFTLFLPALLAFEIPDFLKNLGTEAKKKKISALDYKLTPTDADKRCDFSLIRKDVVFIQRADQSNILKVSVRSENAIPAKDYTICNKCFETASNLADLAKSSKSHRFLTTNNTTLESVPWFSVFLQENKQKIFSFSYYEKNMLVLMKKDNDAKAEDKKASDKENKKEAFLPIITHNGLFLITITKESGSQYELSYSSKYVPLTLSMVREYESICMSTENVVYKDSEGVTKKLGLCFPYIKEFSLLDMCKIALLAISAIVIVAIVYYYMKLIISMIVLVGLVIFGFYYFKLRN
jgi:hypothetical protein